MARAHTGLEYTEITLDFWPRRWVSLHPFLSVKWACEIILLPSKVNIYFQVFLVLGGVNVGSQVGWAKTWSTCG